MRSGKAKPNFKKITTMPEYYRGLFESRFANFYDACFLLSSLGKGKILRKLVIKEITNNPKSILDMATGTGSVAIELKRRFPIAKVIAIDLSDRMLNIAYNKSAHYNLKIKFYQQNIERTDFKSSVFDAVTISFALHEMPQKYRQNVLKEAYRLLRNDGILVLIEHSLPKKFLVRFMQSLFFKIFEDDYAKTILDEPFEKELSEIGFNEIKKKIVFYEAVQIVRAVK